MDRLIIASAIVINSEMYALDQSSSRLWYMMVMSNLASALVSKIGLIYTPENNKNCNAKAMRCCYAKRAVALKLPRRKKSEVVSFQKLGDSLQWLPSVYNDSAKLVNSAAQI